MIPQRFFKPICLALLVAGSLSAASGAESDKQATRQGVSHNMPVQQVDANIRDAIEALHRTFASALERGDAAAVANHFADDAILSPPEADMQRGQSDIQHFYGSFLANVRIDNFELTGVELIVVGDTAYEVGTYRTKLTPQGLSQTTVEGKYLWVCKRASDRTWRILRHIYNINTPPPARK